MPTYTILAILSLCFVVLGFAYAWLIYLSPLPHGFTWVSVVVGDGVVDLSIAFVLIIILEQAGLLNDFWWFILIAPICHILWGGPMIIVQIIKYRQEIKSVRRINDEN